MSTGAWVGVLPGPRCVQDTRVGSAPEAVSLGSECCFVFSLSRLGFVKPSFVCPLAKRTSLEKFGHLWILA